MGEPAHQNLAGLRVLDITQYIAGPTLSRILADLGAEVFKLEMPPGGECSRRGGFPPRVEGQSPAYIYYNRGKRSICIDFKRIEGAAIVVELARHFDCDRELYSGSISEIRPDLRCLEGNQSAHHHVLDFRLRPNWFARQLA